MSACRVSLDDPRADQVSRRAQVLLIRVAPPRPEEPLQSITLPPGHDMNMQMRNALTHPVIDRDEAAFRRHRCDDGSLDRLRRLEQRANLSLRQIGQSLDMTIGNQQYMPGKERSMIEKRERAFSAPDDFSSDLPAPISQKIQLMASGTEPRILPIGRQAHRAETRGSSPAESPR